MSFLHPWAIAMGAAALALPVLVHWLTRPRPVRLPLSTLRFVRQVVQQRRALHRLRDFLILLLRTAAVALVAWAFARPLIGERPLLSEDDTVDAARVVILDVSQSMGAASGGIDAFERARGIAAKHLRYRRGLNANLILAGARARAAFEHCSTNFEALRDELDRASPRPERLDLASAVASAARSLEAAGGEAGPRRELVVISDFQRANWTAADFSPLPQDTLIQLEGVGAEPTPPNVAVLGIAAQGRAQRDRPVRLQVEVGNYAPTPRQVEVELAFAGASYRMEGLCPPGVSTTLSTEVVLRDAGWQSGRARLLGVEDALSADDERAVVLDVQPKPIAGLVTREPADRGPCASYYLERALAPEAGRAPSSSEKVIRILPGQITRESLAPVDLIVLDHPGQLSAEEINLLAAVLRRGRAMLYATAEPADASNLRLLADALGGDLQMPVAFVPPPAGQPRRGLFLTEVRRDDPPFSIFGDQVTAAIAPLRMSGGLASRQIDGGLAEDLVARYSDRSACLVVTACGSGSLAVLNADLGRSNLARSPAFVPLIGELSDRLLGKRHRADAAACGEPLATYLPPTTESAEGLEIAGPPGSGEDLGELIEERAWLLWRWSAAGPPGVYEVRRDDDVLYALATAAPACESDLTPLEPTVLEERLAGGRQVHYQSAGGGKRDESDDFWAWLVVACAGCMLGELLLLKLFRT